MEFISSLYLWFLPLISIPLLIYLFNRNRYKTLYFSSIHFLEIISKKSIKQINIINILLVIIRTLIILFFILLMSRPIYNSKFKSSTTNSSYVLIAIDNSVTMYDYNSNYLKKTILQITKSFDEECIIKIISLDGENILYNGIKREFNLSNIYIQNSFLENNFLFIDSHIKQGDEYLNKFLFIISDGQENILKTNIKKINLSDWYINYINVNKDLMNISIVNVESNHNFILPNDKFKISTTIRNNGTFPITDHLVELFINNINIGRQFIDIAPNQSKKIFFDLSVGKYGYHPAYIKSDIDDITEDNTMHFVIYIKEHLDIDIISNYNNVYLDNILNSFNNKEEIININHHTTNTYLNQPIQSNIIFILGLENINRDILNKINQYNNLEKLRIIIFPELNDISFIDIEALIPNQNFITTKRITYKDDNYNQINTDLIKDETYRQIYSNNKKRNIKVFSYIEIDSDDKTIISMENNKMFMNIYNPNDNMEIFLFSISLNLKSSNYPIKGNIAPFMKNLITTDNILSYTDTYTPIQDLDLNYNSQIITPNKESFIFTESKEDLYFSQLGIYESNYKYKKELLAVNIGESELSSHFLQNIDIKNYFSKDTFIDNDLERIIENIKNISIGYDLWMIFIYIVIFLLMLEMYLSTMYIKNDQ